MSDRTRSHVLGVRLTPAEMAVLRSAVAVLNSGEIGPRVTPASAAREWILRTAAELAAVRKLSK